MNEEAIVWGENCQLRYSNESFFGIADISSDLTFYNMRNIANPNSFRQVVKGLLHNLSMSVSFNPSIGGYAIGQQNYTEINETIYGIVQCTRDLSGDECNRCLQKAILDIQSCCYYYRGARVYSRVCFLRYQLYPLVEAAPTSTENKCILKSHDRREQFPVVIFVVAAILVVVVALLCCWGLTVCWRKRRRKENIESINQEGSSHGVVNLTSTSTLYQNRQETELKHTDLPVMSLATILEITNNFSDSNILGQGCFGPVYKGVQPDGREVAVKRLSIVSDQGSEEFMNEVLLILKLQHKNLVKLLGCCIDEDEKILVYEYMPNRSLDFFLFDPNRRLQLDWTKRLDIITGIARAILYLHQDSRLRIIHRDLKTSNILLDENLNPKISDFGMARMFGGNLGEANTGKVVGTFGYMAPEYAMEGLYSTKSDVYSFGVLLFEIVTGKRNSRFHLSPHAPSLLAYVRMATLERGERGKGLELMDPTLKESCSTTTKLLRCIHIGLLCVQDDLVDRPNMSSIIVMLGNESVPLHQPKQPAFSMGRLIQNDLPIDCSINELTISSVIPR
ncbi:hypothetical protein IFM89_028692 [Coptis chinensis]|uniref:non-specific serine/threonine protein kinase n=1 Tax=Coptis chinensis TaxID=261450 RepID=A0A835I782_9MAGN|nr:hypothetical protein IFM89_028692 [Coptis chinensis]